MKLNQGENDTFFYVSLPGAQPRRQADLSRGSQPSEAEPADDFAHFTLVFVHTVPDPRHHLLEGARRQADLSRGLPHETRKRRLVMWLQRRGHSWDTISGLLEQIELK